MAKRTYAAMLEPATGGGFGVSFPDLPGCTSFGADLDEAVRNAHEALSLHLEGMAEDGERPPAPTNLSAMLLAPKPPTNVVWAAVTVEAPDEADRVNVYLPRSLLERIDRYVEQHPPMNRSTFFGEAARMLLIAEPALAGVAEGGAARPRRRR